jgi:hypothetical protein
MWLRHHIYWGKGRDFRIPNLVPEREYVHCRHCGVTFRRTLYYKSLVGDKIGHPASWVEGLRK